MVRYLCRYQDQQLIGWRIYLPKSNEFIITAHASFEDMRAQSKTPAISNNCTQPISPYSKEEMDLVSIGRIGHMSETKLVERVGETIGGTDMCDARSNKSSSDTSNYRPTNSGTGKTESNGKNRCVEISGMLGPPVKLPAEISSMVDKVDVGMSSNTLPSPDPSPVSYTHLTLPTNREV